jgi:hypothetical protein
MFNWKKIKDRSASLSNIDIGTINRIIPIVVFENGIPIHHGSWSIYENIMIDHGISKEFAKDVLFWCPVPEIMYT